MTVSVSDQGDIVLSGDCPSDDAGPLLERLLAAPHASVDWRACESAHTAVIQILLASGRSVLGPAKHRFLSQWVEPLLWPR